VGPFTDRHSGAAHCGPGPAASDLGLEAARQALADAGLTPESLDLIIVATASPDMVFPATACIIQGKLGAVNAGAFDLTAVCSGFSYALTTGMQAIAAGQAERVLVVAAEKFSGLLDWHDRSTAVLMGDGSGAVVLTSDAPRGKSSLVCWALTAPVSSSFAFRLAGRRNRQRMPQLIKVCIS